MSAYQIVKEIVIYLSAHALAITLMVEGIKLIARAWDRKLIKPAKVLIALALGVTSVYVGPTVVRALTLTKIVCANPADCGGETLFVIITWWAMVSLGSIGCYHLLKLLSADLLAALKRTINDWRMK